MTWLNLWGIAFILTISFSQFQTNLAQESRINDLEILSLQNISQLEQISMFGRGTTEEIVWSADNTQLAVAGSAGIWVYSLSDFDHPQWLNAHQSIVFDVTYSSDGRFLFSAGNDGLRIWDTETWQDPRHYCFSSYDFECSAVSSIASNLDASLLAVAVNDRIVIWDMILEEGKFRIFFDNVSQLIFSQERNHLIASTKGWDNEIRIWDIDQLEPQDDEHFEELKLIESTRMSNWDIAYNEVDAIVAVAGFGFESVGLEIYETVVGNLIATMPGGNAVALHPEQDIIATASYGFVHDEPIYQVQISNYSSLSRIQTLTVDNLPSSLGFSGDGELLAVASATGSLAIFNWRQGSLVSQYFGMGYYHWDVVFNDDGTLLAAVQGNNVFAGSLAGGGAGGGNIIRVWNVQNEVESQQFQASYADYQYRLNQINQIEFLPRTQNLLLAGLASFGFYTWDLVSRPERYTAEEPSYANMVDFALSSDENFVAAIFDHLGTRLVVFPMQLSNGEPILLYETDASNERLQALAISPDTRYLAALSQRGDVFVWDTTSFEQIASTRGASSALSDIVFTPNNETLVVSGNQSLQEFSLILWDIPFDSEPIVLYRDAVVGELTVSPDSRFIISSGASGLVIWDLLDEIEPINIPMHTASITAVTMNSAQTMIATSSYDGTTRLWAVPSANE